MTHVLLDNPRRSVVRPDHRQFRLLWIGEGVSLLGNSTSVVLLALLAVLHLGADATWMGALTAAAWLPWLVVGLAAGAWVDPLPPRAVMIAADLMAAAALVSIPVAWWSGVLTLWQLLIVAFLSGTTTVFFRPAYQKLIPLVVPDAQLETANSRLTGTESATQILGPGLAGLLARLGSAATGVLFDTATFCFSAFCLWRIKVVPTSARPAVRTSLRSRISEGIRVVAHDPFLRAFTLIGALSNFGLTGFNTLLVLYWSRTLHLPAQEIGVLLMIAGGGGVVGAFGVTWLCHRIGTGRASTALLLISGPTALLIGIPNSGKEIWLSVIGLTLMDGAVVAGNALRAAWRQRYVPAALMARVITSSQFVNCGTMPFAALVAGALGGSLGVRPTILLLAGVHALACISVLAVRAGRVRDLPAHLVG